MMQYGSLSNSNKTVAYAWLVAFLKTTSVPLTIVSVFPSRSKENVYIFAGAFQIVYFFFKIYHISEIFLSLCIQQKVEFETFNPSI